MVRLSWTTLSVERVYNGSIYKLSFVRIHLPLHPLQTHLSVWCSGQCISQIPLWDTAHIGALLSCLSWTRSHGTVKKEKIYRSNLKMGLSIQMELEEYFHGGKTHWSVHCQAKSYKSEPWRQSKHTVGLVHFFVLEFLMKNHCPYVQYAGFSALNHTADAFSWFTGLQWTGETNSGRKQKAAMSANSKQNTQSGSSFKLPWVL